MTPRVHRCSIDVWHAAWPVGSRGQTGDQASASDGESMRGDHAGLVAIAYGERLPQDRLHVRGERLVWG